MRRKSGMICMTLGAVLILAALSLFVYNHWENLHAEEASQTVLESLKAEMDEEDIRDTPGETESEETLENREMETIEIDGYAYIGTLSIPRFGLELPVMSEWSYPGLRIAPGRYSGSVYTDDLVIAGHNYQRHFGNLKNLEAGDSVVFTDVSGNTYTYEVQEVVQLKSTAVQEMTAGIYDLTLFTCTVGGRARVTVRCMRTEESEEQ